MPPDIHDAGMLVTRRRVIQAGGVAAATIYLGGLTSTAAAATSAGAPAYLRRSSYATLRNTPFTVARSGAPAVTLRLADIADLARAAREQALAGRDDAFALTFTGPRGTPLAAASYPLRQTSLGSFALFLGPIGRPTATLQTYEVVVDRSLALASAQAAAPRQGQAKIAS